MNDDENALNVYTDGSSSGSPRVGGVGIRIIFPEYSKKPIKDICPFGYLRATNNQMELKACVLALQEVMKLGDKWSRIIIHTDSSYVVDNHYKAMFEWSKKWRTRSGSPVLNADLWREFNRNRKKIKTRLDISWVKGHKNEHNKVVDRLAKKSALKAINSPIVNVNLRRKTVSKGNGVGGIKMIGQRTSIRIFTSQYLNIQKIHRYKYEIISKKSPYYKFSGNIFSDKQLSNGHSYSVRFNMDDNYPQIVKVFKDIT